VISGFRRVVDEICAVLGYYAASNVNPYRSTLHNILEERSFMSVKVIFVSSFQVVLVCESHTDGSYSKIALPCVWDALKSIFSLEFSPFYPGSLSVGMVGIL
jgi:hypothetical protein